MLYPLKFNPIFKEKIWGGEKIGSFLGKDFSPLSNCGETWEISAVEGNVSVVSEGPLKGTELSEIIKHHTSELLGQSVYDAFGTDFPLLIKFIDAKEDLSIQVHPNDELAQQRHNCFGKSEMWYIFQADEGASLISGFSKKVDKESYLEAFNNGKLEDILCRTEVQAGDVFNIPAGRVHTIGAGILLAEIQQTSDITYRIYDFDRKDKEGNLRELHVEEALDAISYEYQESYKTSYETVKNSLSPVVSSPYFETNKFLIDEEIIRDYDELDSFVIYICYKGKAIINSRGYTTEMKKGDALLIPANLDLISIEPLEETEFLETYIPEVE